MATVRSKTLWDPVLAAARGDQLVAESLQAARPAATASLPHDLSPALAAALARAGISELYSHQTACLQSARAGHTMLTTGTASGKSLAFNLPVLDTLSTHPGSRALYLYPTKALAQDQARKLADLGVGFVRHAIYDGDTPRDSRRDIRRRSNLVLTNPDMLSVGILPHHGNWADALANLAWVVVDEAHVYRGVFGSHVANVLRRLRRLCRAYGADPHFILTSATIANPKELARRLTGLDCTLVDRDGAPRAQRQVALWNPPLVDTDLGKRRSVLTEAALILASLLEAGVRTICFLKSRRGIELIQRFTAAELERRGRGALAQRIASYRGGYTPQQRREIERKLAAGELEAVVATDALELGIDVGELDAALCVTFPGTVASLRQMWGRAGRRSAGLALFVAGDDALDQFFCRHPQEFLDRPVEAAILDHTSESIYLQHMLAAAYEQPLAEADASTLGPSWQDAADQLVREQNLRKRGDRYTLRRGFFPAGEISLRSASAHQFAIVEQDSGELIGSIEQARAFSTVHPGAIYLHLGQSYEVEELDARNRRAVVRRHDGDWYTQPKTETETYIERVEQSRTACGTQLSFGMVSVVEQVVAFQRKRVADNEVIDLQALMLPQQEFATQGLWFELDESFLSDLAPEVVLSALHACEHGQIAVLPLIAMCDRWDIGGLSTRYHHQTARPTVFIYDGHPGGIGIARTGFSSFERLAADAHRLIGECPCRSGCPSCVQSPKCGNLNEYLNKGAALELLERMVAAS